MPANKNALIRYKTINNCLRNRYRRWTLDDLVDACCDALYDMEGITKGVCSRTVQMDIQIMRSDKLGYNAPIEVYDRIYYRYADPNYSITEMPLSVDDCKLIKEAIALLGKKEDADKARTLKVLKKVENRLVSILNFAVFLGRSLFVWIARLELTPQTPKVRMLPLNTISRKREFDRIRTCVNKSHNLAPKPLGHKLHIVAPEGVEPSLAEPKPAVLPLYHRAVNRWGGRTRTYEAERRQIYSLLSLPLENTPIMSGASWS